MNLSKEDADLFFKLMWAAQFYVNQCLKLIPNVSSVETYKKLPQEEKMKVREALYAQIELLDTFISENPANLNADELEIVACWKDFIASDFYILKFLKRHTIFIQAKGEDRVYAVLGLHEAIEDVFYGRRPPILVKTVLLPFKGHIIYDGLFNVYSIFFGSGIRGSLNEAYQRAKQNGNIIESLEAGIAAPPQLKPPKVTQDWQPVLDDVVKTTEKLRQAETVIQSKAFSLLKASAKVAQATAHDPDNLAELNRLAKRVQTALNQLETALNRAE